MVTVSSLTGMAAKGVYCCLEEMGQRQSNPVLEVLPWPDRVEQGVKYPPGRLCFGDGPLRAYYHVHPEPYLRPGEHGHFHLFVANSQDQSETTWCHVAGLSMDQQGQPLHWFTVNNWVTGGAWLDADSLGEAIKTALTNDPANRSLLEQWLAGMLGLYLPELLVVLQERDAVLAAQSTGRSQPEVLQDRAIYELSTLPINLLDRLQTRLVGQTV
jgi:hypothetical protein